MTEAGFSLTSVGDHVEPGIWVKVTELDGQTY
jgi:hypothetical protein